MVVVELVRFDEQIRGLVGDTLAESEFDEFSLNRLAISMLLMSGKLILGYRL